MSQASIVLAAMREGRDYSAHDLHISTQIPVTQVEKILRLAAKAGVIEVTESQRPYRKLRKFQTRQRELAF